MIPAFLAMCVCAIVFIWVSEQEEQSALRFYSVKVHTTNFFFPGLQSTHNHHEKLSSFEH